MPANIQRNNKRKGYGHFPPWSHPRGCTPNQKSLRRPHILSSRGRSVCVRLWTPASHTGQAFRDLRGCQMEWWRGTGKDDRNGERKMLKSGSETIWMLYYCVTGGGYRLYGGDKGRLGQTSRAPGNWKVMNIAVDGFPRRTLIAVGSFFFVAWVKGFWFYGLPELCCIKLVLSCCVKLLERI